MYFPILKAMNLHKKAEEEKQHLYKTCACNTKEAFSSPANTTLPLRSSQGSSTREQQSLFLHHNLLLPTEKRERHLPCSFWWGFLE